MFRKVLLLFFGSLIVGQLGGYLQSARAQSFAHLNLDADRVSWVRLTYQGKNSWSEVLIRLQLESLPTAAVEAALIKTPQGDAIRPASPAAYKLSLSMTIDSNFHSAIRIDNQVWFNPIDATALGRIRFQRGDDDFKKIYRFTQQGVYRHRREPENEKQFSLDPQEWTDVRDTFYPYNLVQLGCPNVSERLVLVYIVSIAEISKSSTPLSLCVFGKRQLHHVKLVPDGEEKLELNYIEKKQQSEVQRQETVNARKIALEVQPMESDLEEAETFSFLGLHEDLVFFIDSKSNLPVQLSGKIRKLGKVTFKLTEVQLKSNID